MDFRERERGERVRFFEMREGKKNLKFKAHTQQKKTTKIKCN